VFSQYVVSAWRRSPNLLQSPGAETSPVDPFFANLHLALAAFACYNFLEESPSALLMQALLALIALYDEAAGHGYHSPYDCVRRSQST